MKQLVEGFRTDMAIVDKEVNNTKEKYSNENEQLKIKLQSVSKEATELGSLLEAAVKSDTRKEAMIKEMQVAFDTEKKKVEQWRKELKEE